MLRVCFLIFVISIATRSEASNSLGSEVTKCIDAVPREQRTCGNGDKCSAELVSKQMSKCMKKAGVKSVDCRFDGGLWCRAEVDNNFIATSSGCSLAVLWRNDKLDSVDLVSTSREQVCKIGGYQLGDTGFSVSKAKRVRDSWSIRPPVVSFGFEKFVNPSVIIIENLAEAPARYWTEQEGEEDWCSKKIEDMQSRIDSQKWAEIKSIYTDGNKVDGNPRRHYIGNSPDREFSLVEAFRLKKPTKICGITVPADTFLYAHYDSSSCVAGSSGTISLSRIPIVNDPDGKKIAYCTPRAGNESSISGLSRRPKGTKPPDIDWQVCDCSPMNE